MSGLGNVYKWNTAAATRLVVAGPVLSIPHMGEDNARPASYPIRVSPKRSNPDNRKLQTLVVVASEAGFFAAAEVEGPTKHREPRDVIFRLLDTWTIRSGI
jgi:hypothetical protein